MRWQQEQEEWQNKLLPKLWVSKPKTIPLESKVPPIQISVIRPVNENKSAWELQTHTLKSEVAEELFDAQGQWKPKPVKEVQDSKGNKRLEPQYSGNHRVFPIESEGQRFWVKVYPEQPAMEWIVHQLDRRLGVFGTPRFEVVKFHHGGQTSCALISEHIEGATLRKVIETNSQALENLAFDAFARTLLRVLLINPEDDKDDDYLLVEESKGKLCLKRIDNERAFFEPLIANNNILFNKTTLQVKSVIYCLEQMRQNWSKEPAIQHLLEEWRQLRAVSLMQDLLQEAQQQHLAWKELFSLKELQHHFKLPDPEKSLPLMFIPQGLTKEIITRLTLIQTTLRLASSTSDAKDASNIQEAKAYPLCGLTLLQDTQPKLGEYYAKAHWDSLIPEEGKNPLEIPLHHRHVQKRFNEHVGRWYQKNVQGGLVSGISASKAIQTSLRFPHPLKPDELKDIWQGTKSSPTQELAVLRNWHKQRLETLTTDLLTPKARGLTKLKELPQNRGIKAQEEEQLWRSYQTRLAEDFRALPLRQRNQMWLVFRLKLRDKQLDSEQQLFLLNAMTGVGWEQLDLSVFHPDLITQKRLTALLEGGQQEPLIALKTLDISGCQELTVDILSIIQRYSQKTLKQLKCNRLTRPSWQTVALQNWDELQHFECRGSNELRKCTFDAVPKLTTLDFSESWIDTISGSASQLITLRLHGCRSLTQVGARPSFWQNRFLSLPQLRYLDIADCANLGSLYLPLPTSIFLDHLIPQLDSCPKLKAIELQTNEGWWTQVDFNFLIPSFKSQSKIIDFSDEDRLTPRQLKVLAVYYLPVDRYFTQLDLSDNRLDDKSITLLVQGLTHNKTLTHLDLTGNTITRQGAMAIATMLRSNTAVVSLDLWGNDISWAGAEAIAKAMRTNTTLQELRHHYAHYAITSWNRNKPAAWVEVGDYIKRIPKSLKIKESNRPQSELKTSSLPPQSFFAVSRASHSISDEKYFSTPSSSLNMKIDGIAPRRVQDVKQGSSLLDEKAKTKFLKLQDKLVVACEKGNLAAVKKAISKGAEVNQPNALGKQPLYAAVYGMNPEVVNYVIARRDENSLASSWQACEEHNKEHYGQSFLNMNFAPITYKDWYDLLPQIQPNEFLSGYHVACGGERGAGPHDRRLTAWAGLVAWTARHREGHMWHPPETAMLMGSDGGQVQRTEQGFDGYRNQIKRVLEVLHPTPTLPMGNGLSSN